MSQFYDRATLSRAMNTPASEAAAQYSPRASPPNGDAASIYSRTCAIGDKLSKARERFSLLVQRLAEHRNTMHGEPPTTARLNKSPEPGGPIPTLTNIEQTLDALFAVADEFEIVLSTII